MLAGPLTEKWVAGAEGVVGVPPPPPPQALSRPNRARSKNGSDLFMVNFRRRICATQSSGQGMSYPITFLTVRWPAAGVGKGPKVQGLYAEPPLINTSGGMEPPAFNWTTA